LFSDTAGNSPQFVLATYADVGAVWGLAFRRSEPALYAAAVQKRQFHFGPGGPGAIYRIDLSTGDTTLFVTVPNPGQDTHEESNASRDVVAPTMDGSIGLTCHQVI
jgi:hypothetical protein